MLGTDADKQELALQGAGAEQNWGCGKPRLSGSCFPERPEFLHPPSAGKATEGSYHVFGMCLAPAERFLSATL